ncbi:hypothetical protein GCM10023085_33550 [Actinomadura viridis]|uniref:Uncharacterized protein n=1 Tax=Actinomadura viridis TaxID=58110 RepID=A0A931DEA1_9ACTN|nr:hypothetical protein [Actinomadura viridis]MBG6087028.1 hypothetical protein [Actinomadura viridis]
MAFLRILPLWRIVTSNAHALPGDLDMVLPYLQGDGWPADLAESLTAPTPVRSAGKSPRYIRNAQRALAGALPGGRSLMVPKQGHQGRGRALAEPLRRFFLAADDDRAGPVRREPPGERCGPGLRDRA